MDSLSTAGAFATIVGLICNYKNQKKAISDNEYRAFCEWLQSKQHDEVIQYLEQNGQVVNSIRHFLEEDNRIILEKLATIDNLVSKIATGIDGLAEISLAVKPNQGLSRQCISILKQLSESKGSRFIEVRLHGQPSFQIIDGSGGCIVYEESRFIEDDLLTLLELGLLRLDYGSSGSRIFYFTRAASNLLQDITSESE